MKHLAIFDRWTTATLIIVGGWMLWAAGHYTVFDDEAFSCQRYVLPMGEMLRGLWHDVEPDPPLYYVLENLSIHQLGISPLGLRALSIIMFLAGLLFMRATATEAWGDRTGIATMVLCAVHPAHLFFGFAARWYSTMFLAVAVLLYVSRRLMEIRTHHASGGRGVLHSGEPPRSADDSPIGASRPRLAAWVLIPTRRWTILWAMAAAAVLYTNYFGVVVVGMIWLAATWRSPDKRRFIAAGGIAALLFAPWLPPFWTQMTAFPKFSGSAGSMLATAARTTMALLAGDLASPRAWWVWGPMAVIAVLLSALVIQHWQRVRLITLVVAGCFFAGVVSRTMIDKYVMTFSGIACMLVAAVLSRVGHMTHPTVSTLRISAIAALTLAWLGCAYNLIAEKHWSSLRWLDPFEDAVADAKRAGVPSEDWVVTHPSGKYYAARAFTRSAIGDSVINWMRLAMPEYRSKKDNYLRTPARLLLEINKRSVPEVITLEAAGFSDSPEWDKLRHLLESDYRLEEEHHYLDDPDAAWKDRLDPEYHHPHWRITVRHWRRK